ncbi:aminotransferase class IV [Pontibacter chitinilyticus]|uniref:aminotransferase class IV n=1 Tax=Pontibacter chitinilyticus TaxID=2674989 RepID=UPI00321A8947
MLLYNGHIIPEEALRLPLSNRAFQYNDGFFETMIVLNGRIRFWNDHVARMQEAVEALRLSLFDQLSPDELQQQLLHLAALKNASGYGRLKLKVWRSGAGLYTPQTDAADWLATAQPTQAAADEPLTIGICQQTQTLLSPFSHFKGPNALLYVMAGHEKQAGDYKDMLLLSFQGDVAELISSTIFWLQGDVLFTPALTTGCVNGILRRNVLRVAPANGFRVEEVSTGPAALYRADAVFAANVTGIRSIKAINEKEVAGTDHLFLQLLQQALFAKV